MIAREQRLADLLEGLVMVVSYFDEELQYYDNNYIAAVLQEADNDIVEALHLVIHRWNRV